jgi:hypothetical protein
MWCLYCDKNNHNHNHNTADCRAIAKFKQQKKKKACFEAKAGPGKKSLAFLVIFKEINALKRRLVVMKVRNRSTYLLLLKHLDLEKLS